VKAISSGTTSGGQDKDEYFGPRPVQGLIKGKIEEANNIMNSAA